MLHSTASDTTDRLRHLGEVLMIEPWWKNPVITTGLMLLALAGLFIVYHQLVEKPRAERRREQREGSGWTLLDGDQD